MTLDDQDPAQGLPELIDPPARDEDPAAAAARAADLRLARLHLRLGSFTLARAELEAAHAVEPLAGGPLLDLAEARWRTGEVVAAGEPAERYMASAGDSLLAAVIAVEACMADGRPSEARALASNLGEPAGADLDDIFAGMPRSSFWPADPAIAGPAAPAQRLGPVTGPAHLAGAPGGAARHQVRIPSASGGGARPRLGGRERWESEGSNPSAELDAARADLDAGDLLAASVRLAVLLRRTPALAPAVLEALEGAPGPLAAVVRGDAFRLVGRETEAARAFASAAAEVVGTEAAEGDRVPDDQLPADDIPDAAAIDSDQQSTLEE